MSTLPACALGDFEGALAIRNSSLEVHMQSQQLDDAGASRWCVWAREHVPAYIKKHSLQRRPDGFLYAREVNFSSNNLGDHGVHMVLRMLHQLKLGVRVLKFFKNNLGRAAASALMDWLVVTPIPALELHLSHNFITREGAVDILKAVAYNSSYPPEKPGRGRVPLWLRMEQNIVVNPEELIASAEKQMRKIRAATSGSSAPASAVMLCYLRGSSPMCSSDYCVLSTPDGLYPIAQVTYLANQRDRNNVRIPRESTMWVQSRGQREEAARWRMCAAVPSSGFASSIARTPNQEVASCWGRMRINENGVVKHCQPLPCSLPPPTGPPVLNTGNRVLPDGVNVPRVKPPPLQFSLAKSPSDANFEQNKLQIALPEVSSPLPNFECGNHVLPDGAKAPRVKSPPLQPSFAKPPADVNFEQNNLQITLPETSTPLPNFEPVSCNIFGPPPGLSMPLSASSRFGLEVRSPPPECPPPSPPRNIPEIKEPPHAEKASAERVCSASKGSLVFPPPPFPAPSPPPLRTLTEVGDRKAPQPDFEALMEVAPVKSPPICGVPSTGTLSRAMREAPVKSPPLLRALQEEACKTLPLTGSHIPPVVQCPSSVKSPPSLGAQLPPVWKPHILKRGGQLPPPRDSVLSGESVLPHRLPPCSVQACEHTPLPHESCDGHTPPLPEPPPFSKNRTICPQSTEELSLLSPPAVKRTNASMPLPLNPLMLSRPSLGTSQPAPWELDKGISCVPSSGPLNGSGPNMSLLAPGACVVRRAPSGFEPVSDEEKESRGQQPSRSPSFSSVRSLQSVQDSACDLFCTPNHGPIGEIMAEETQGLYGSISHSIDRSSCSSESGALEESAGSSQLQQSSSPIPPDPERDCALDYVLSEDGMRAVKGVVCNGSRGAVGILDLAEDHPAEVLKEEIRRQRKEIAELLTMLAKSESSSPPSITE